MATSTELTGRNSGTARTPDGKLRYAVVVAVTLAAIFLAYLETFRSMVVVWLSTDTYIHCFIILPISAFLIWRKWPELSKLSPAPYLPGAFVLLGLSLIWLVSDFFGIQLGKHFSVVAMLPAAMVTLTGRRYSGVIAFPLGYLVFAVPFGELLIPYLVEFTAWFTVAALNFTGIPVMRDGIYFSIPAGNFEVARACSGIRYLLATLALGTLYAYITYHSRRKRLIFFIIALVLPIIANGFRAYGIVMLAHFSDMKIAVGVDHLIFGWVFFGLVITILFVIGARFGDDPQGPPSGRDNDLLPEEQHSRPAAIVTALVLAVAFVFAGPVLSATINRGSGDQLTNFSGLPGAIPGWEASDVFEADLTPKFLGASRELYASYIRDGQRVNVAVIQYAGHRQGAELANIHNVVLEKAGFQRISRMNPRTVGVRDDRVMTIKELVANRAMSRAVVWYWFSVNGHLVNNDIEIKIQEGRSLLRGETSISTAIVLGANVAPGAVDTARSVLQEFLVASSGPIEHCLALSMPHPDCGLGIDSKEPD